MYKFINNFSIYIHPYVYVYCVIVHIFMIRNYLMYFTKYKVQKKKIQIERFAIFMNVSWLHHDLMKREY